MALDIRPSLHSSAPESLSELREMLGSLEAQLVSVYEEQEQTALRAVAPDETLSALYEDKQRLSARTIVELRASVESMAAQLADCYETREGNAAPSGSAEMHDMLGSLTAQLEALYEEHSTAPYSISEAVEMVHSLEAQVGSLLEERDDLAEQASRASHDVQNAKRRGRELVNALVDQAFA